MARITIEDCTKNIQNRFNLVVMASQRARQILSGAEVTVDVDNDKVPVIALREIAGGSVSLEDIYNHAVKKYRKYIPNEEMIDNLDEDVGEELYAPISAASNDSVSGGMSGDVLDDDIKSR